MAITLSGSLILSGSIEATGGVTISGSIASASYAANAGTASYVVNSLTASYVVNSLTASYVVNSLTASFVANAVSSSYSLNALTSSNAMTASSADTLYVRNNVTALGSITAQTLVVQTVTSSVLFSTGSNKIGSSLSNVQELTGSVGITGSLAVVTTGTEFQVNAGGVNIGNALTDNHIISGSVTINPNGLFVSSSGNVGIGTTSPSTKLYVQSADADFISVFKNTNASGYGLQVYTQGSGTNLAFQVRSNNGAINALQVLDNGNVGIGTTSPTGNANTILHINGTDSAELHLTRSNSGTSSTLGGYVNFDGSNNFNLQNRSSGTINFITGTTERMRITSDGSIDTKGNPVFAHSGSITMNGTYQTIFTAASNSVYLVSVNTSISAGDGTYGLLIAFNEADKVCSLIDGNNISLQFSGDNVQIRSNNSAGYATTWTATRLK